MSEEKIFDITKVRFKGYLCGLKAGCKGYFSDTMSGLQHCVEEDYQFNFGKIKKINENSESPFVNKEDVEYRYFYLVEEPKGKMYRPYTWEEREQLRGKWIKRKDNAKDGEKLVIILYVTNDDLFMINNMNSEYVLDNYEFLDSSPCGVEIVEGEKHEDNSYKGRNDVGKNR